MTVLKQICKARKITIKAIAEKTGLSRHVVSRILNNEGNPYFENVKKVVEAIEYKLTISIAEL